MSLYNYFESKLPDVKRGVVLVYSGRFHPPGPHHLQNIQQLQKIADSSGAQLIVLMSPATGGANRPFTVDQRKKMIKSVFPSVEVKIQTSGSMYSPLSVMSKDDLDKNSYVVCVGQKDMEGDSPRLKIGGKSFFRKIVKESELNPKRLKPAENEGYVFVLPNRMGGRAPAASSSVRRMIADGEWDKIELLYRGWGNQIVSLIKKASQTISFDEAAGHHIHVEELLYDEDLPATLSVLERTVDELQKLEGDGLVTLKVDGSPAFLFGRDRQGFFVAYKGAAVAKEPELFRTTSAIKKKYADKPELAKKFVQLFNHLPKIIKRLGVWQGDLIFDSDDKTVTPGSVSFKPNTLRYVIPRESKLYSSAARALIGIAVHTRMKGQAGAFESAGPANDSDFVDHPSVFRMGVRLRGLKFDSKKIDMIRSSIKLATSRIDKLPRMTPQFKALMERGINAAIKAGVDPRGMTSIEVMKRIRLILKLEKVSEKTRAKKLEALENERETVDKFMRSYATVMSLKNDVISMIDSALASAISTEQGRHEGYVIKTGPRTVKLVDRQSFSRLNFINNELKKGKNNENGG